MRWEDERYVRLYTRDTVDWHFLSFEAQGLLCLLLRKVDRAGILALGRHGRAGIPAALGHPSRSETIAVALAELERDGCVSVDPEETQLVFRNYVEAQEAKSSDKARQQKSRETARDLAAAKGKQNQAVTEPLSHGVTRRHTASQPVTPSRAVPSRAVPSMPSRAEPAEEADSKSLSSAGAAGDSPELALEFSPPPKSDRAAEVVAHYVEAMKANGVEVRDTPSKRKLAAKALKHWSPTDLKAAIDGLTHSDWHMGRDPKSNGGSWTGLEYAIGDDKRIEANLQRARATGPPPRRHAPCAIHACEGENSTGFGLCPEHLEQFKADPETQRLPDVEDRIAFLPTWIQDRNARTAA